MCIQNINITGTLFKKVVYETDYKSFERPFDVITAKISNSVSYIEDFAIVLNFCLMGTNNPNNKETNIVNRRDKLDVLIRLSKVSKYTEKQLSIDLAEFTLDIKDDSDLIISRACVDYITLRKVFTVSRIDLNSVAGLGDYVFKILVKTPEQNNWNVQSYIPLRIQ